MSLMDRLAGRKPAQAKTPTGSKSEPDAPAAASNGAEPIEDDEPVASLRIGAMARNAELTTAELSTVDQLKVDIHHRLIQRLDLEALEKMTDEGEIVAQIRIAVGEFLRTESTPLSQLERDEIVEHIVWEITGLGPIEPLFRDTSITDILVNNAHDIFVERKGKLIRVNTQFRNDAHLMAVIDRIVSRVGRRVDES